MATSSLFKKSSRGGALIAALLLVVITLLLTTGYVDTLTTENKTAKDNENSQLALYAADAGIQYALEAVRSSTTNDIYSTNNVGGTFFPTPSGNQVQFKLARYNGDLGTCAGCSGPCTDDGGAVCPSCPAGKTCARSTAIGQVVDGSGNIIAKRIVEAIITTGTDGNIVQWNEYYI